MASACASISFRSAACRTWNSPARSASTRDCCGARSPIATAHGRRSRGPLTRRARSRRLYRDHGYLGAVVRCDAQRPSADGGQHRPDLSRRAGTARHNRRREDRRGSAYRARHAGAATRRATGIALRSRRSCSSASTSSRRSSESAASTRRRPARARRSPRTRASVDLTIAVRSGPAVTVRYEGDPLPADRLKELVPVERENSATEDLLEDSIVAIRAYLRQQGYWKGGRFMASRGDCRSVVPRLSNQEGHAVLRRRAGPVERQPGNPGRRAADDDCASSRASSSWNRGCPARRPPSPSFIVSAAS